MSIENKQSLFSSSLLRIERVCCQRARRGLSCEECKAEHQIAIPLSGVNVRQVNGESFTISPAHITLSNRGEAYRVGHPYGSGETQLNIVLQEALLLELLCTMSPATQTHPERPFLRRQLPITTKLHLGVQMLMTAAQSPGVTRLEMEETTLALVGELLSAVDQPANDTTLSLRDRELAQHAQAVVASSFSRPIALQDVASRLNTSVYHLCRAFKRATGATLWSEVQRLRTRASLTHLASGATDLTALGLTLGYAHHSHFTAAFRREVGFTPSVARRILTTGSIAQVRELLAH